MKIGFCMLLWTTAVDDSHKRLIADIQEVGYDGIEVPVFGGTPDEYAALGKMLDEMGLGRTAISVIGGLDQNPLSEDAADRARGVQYLKWLVDCAAALGAEGIGGPLHQTLGHFSGAGPTEAEFERARDVHRAVGDHAAANGQVIALEAINRFESYFANTMDDLCAYTRSVGHPAIKSMYDTFHANLEEQDPIAAYTRNADEVVHVHISENDRGVPGRGHVPWAETFKAIKASGYDGWLTIEAFGRGLPDLAAATRVWRDFAESPEAYYRDGYRCIREGWDAA
ncbi:D-tagatose 3-epimerase [Candidatus Rhodobacter oscarellae]|uniref:D-tagatose 3-epimerase n=1 Tax=Candidatus Rhodobacter oscarellae TaxID=1675527 RepID=A0A0J9EAJ8_9RHOB|nr:sugar phosphate isomerase/epimerase [Candidatus Rhodobacter lobularis]KMW59820.1 D-tagatose 3-epimerase [Candidatus Rhodobacter lobularis]